MIADHQETSWLITDTVCLSLPDWRHQYKVHSSIGWRKNFSELYFRHFQIDWMLLLIYCFVIFHIDLNLGPDTSHKVINQSPAPNTGPMRASGLWLVTLLGVSTAGFCTMCEITKQYLNKIIQSNRKCLKYRSEKFLRQPNDGVHDLAYFEVTDKLTYISSC